jgi:hypothetical protein
LAPISTPANAATPAPGFCSIRRSPTNFSRVWRCADRLRKIEGHVRAAEWKGAKVRAGGGRLESNELFTAPTIVEKVTPAIATAYYDS